MAGVCTGRFEVHDLPHITLAKAATVRFYESNGSGVAINDLDNDGDLDIVLATLDAANTILWNLGHLHFEKQLLATGRSRAVNIVDVDGDGWQDIVFSQGLGSLVYWRNNANHTPQFDMKPMSGIRQPAYAMAWGDINRDGQLDVATGSYDAELQAKLGNNFLLSGGAGVFAYLQFDGAFTSTRLADNAHALALLLADVDGSQHDTLLVGNDFLLSDRAWVYRGGNWQTDQPFVTTTVNTMSFDAADINNDGLIDVFAADMKPVSDDPNILRIWQPVFDTVRLSALPPNDPQVMENVLNVRQPDGRYVNQAPQTGVAATGWTWSAGFGDFDHDGFQDLYAVNGMIAAELFGSLPNDELVETNHVFANRQGTLFVPMPSWKLDSTASGRGMSIADLDADGDLDIVVNNLRSAAQLFENRVCGGSSIEIDLEWLNSRNPRTVGATVTLHTSTGVYTRQHLATRGYLSGAPSRLHIGFPASSVLHKLVVYWPDGHITTLDSVTANMLLTITRS